MPLHSTAKCVNVNPTAAHRHRVCRRSIVRSVRTRGDIAGLREGERSRRNFDVFLRRPSAGQYRNAAWETDHVDAAVEVDVDGRLMKPWVAWFVDTAYCVIMGAAVTAESKRASRDRLPVRVLGVVGIDSGTVDPSLGMGVARCPTPLREVDAAARVRVVAKAVLRSANPSAAASSQ